MSTAPLTAGTPRVRERLVAHELSGVRTVASAVLLGVVGLFAISSTCLALWGMWATDPLKSIGALIPIVSLVLILRAWRSLGWEIGGSWWGLALLSAMIAIVHLRDQAVLELVISPAWAITLPPYSLVAIAYAAGFVLLFGGTRLLRAVWFPVALMGFVNPVPHFFLRYVDLPLQHASALIARAFAHGLGQQLTPDQLSLMFTPKFGMFIAPGCNGIRGAITMGLIALVAGYLYQLGWRRWAALTAGAVVLGYAFNFVRLCALVLYYLLALRYPWLQNRAEMADYILGACLFFFATTLLFSLLLRWSPERNLRAPRLPRDVRAPDPHASRLVLRAAAFGVVIALGSVSYARGMMATERAPGVLSDVRTMPKQLGEYTRSREWNETLDTGAVIFHWAEYRPGGGGAPVSLGISPTLAAHDTLICHAARGDDWIWHGPLQLQTAAGITSLSASLFNTGSTQYLEAAAICSAGQCNQTSTARRHLGFIFSRPAIHALLTQDPARPIPILIRVETDDAAMPSADARAQLVADLQRFLSGVDLASFTQPYRHR